jgi:hypothetical protein
LSVVAGQRDTRRDDRGVSPTRNRVELFKGVPMWVWAFLASAWAKAVPGMEALHAGPRWR